MYKVEDIMESPLNKVCCQSLGTPRSHHSRLIRACVISYDGSRAGIGGGWLLNVLQPKKECMECK
jgi:hypothetical protein